MISEQVPIVIRCQRRFIQKIYTFFNSLLWEDWLFSPKININKTNHTDVQRIGDQDISQQEKDKMEETNQMHLDIGESQYKLPKK